MIDTIQSQNRRLIAENEALTRKLAALQRQIDAVLVTPKRIQKLYRQYPSADFPNQYRLIEIAGFLLFQSLLNETLRPADFDLMRQAGYHPTRDNACHIAESIVRDARERLGYFASGSHSLNPAKKEVMPLAMK